MQVTETKIELDSSWFSAERDIKRTEGLHLSHVIDFIEENEGKKLNRSEDKTSLHRYAAAGFLWERAIDKITHLTKEELWEYVFTQALFEIDNPKVFRPGEQKVDAGSCPVCNGTGKMESQECLACKGSGTLFIYATPDGVSIPKDEAAELRLSEQKYTSKSFKDGIKQDKFKRWIEFQIPFYLYSLGLHICDLQVYFSKGDYYATTGQPQWISYELVYSDTEIAETAGMIINNARVLTRQLYLGASH